MTYLQSHSTTRNRRTRLIVVVIVILIVVTAIVNVLAPHFFPAVFLSIARPYWRATFSISSGSLRSPAALLLENENLRNRIDSLQTDNDQIEALKNENSELKALLGRASTSPYKLAAVLERPPYAGYDRIIIDVGTSQGLKVGNIIYAPGNIRIGKISDVFSQTSKVTLYSSPGQTYQVLIGHGHTPATALGRGGGQYTAELPRDVTVAAGDIVSATTLNDDFFGVVSAIEADPAQPFKTVYFAPPVNIYQLRWVLVDDNSS